MKRRGIMMMFMTVIMMFAFRVPANAATNSRYLPDGWYMIVSGNSEDRVQDINNWNKNNGGNLETYAKNNTTNQRFYLKYLNNGYYSIRALHSGKYLHVADERNRMSNVHQWSGYSHKNAQWELRPAGNGYYYLRNRNNGSYLDNSNASTALGNNVHSYPFNGTNAQKWKFLSTSNGYDEKRTIPDGWYEVQSGNNTSYVWDINSASDNDGANLEIHQKHGGNNQKFYLRYLNNGYYAIMAGNSNKYLHKQNAGHTDNVVQWASYSTSAIQTQWAIAYAGNGYYYIRSKAGNYVDNSGGTVKNSNNVITYTWNGTYAQKWRLVSTTPPKDDITSWQMPMTNAYVCGNNWLTYYKARPSRPYHLGVDIASRSGDENVYAASNGTVASVGYNSANGNYVIIKHSVNGKIVYSFYGHLKNYCVKKGNNITKGSKIGVFGNTGSASAGRHLHFAIIDTLYSSGGYYGYGTASSGDKATYKGAVYYNPFYVVNNGKLP